MTIEIPEELRNKLEIIEEETSFFSKVPLKPSRFHLISLVVFGLGISVYIRYMVFNDSELGTPTFALVILMYAAQIVGYLHQKILFDQYSSACKIINLYKNVLASTET